MKYLTNLNFDLQIQSQCENTKNAVKNVLAQCQAQYDVILAMMAVMMLLEMVIANSDI